MLIVDSCVFIDTFDPESRWASLAQGDPGARKQAAALIGAGTLRSRAGTKEDFRRDLKLGSALLPESSRIDH